MAEQNVRPFESGGRYDFDPKEYLQQGPWRDVRLGLHRTEELLERLGRPQDALRIVHVAGTNGKGSTCAFIAGIWQAAGYKTCLLYTSWTRARFPRRPRRSAWRARSYRPCCSTAVSPGFPSKGSTSTWNAAAARFYARL